MDSPPRAGSADGHRAPGPLRRRTLLRGAAGLAGAALLGACTGSDDESGLEPPFEMGALADRPAASADNTGRFYLATDENGGTLFASTGESWVPAQVRLENT